MNARPKPPTVSVLMNCYNGEAYLRDAIDSVYAQDYDDWEIVFWDNQSSDESATIAKDADERLRYFHAETFLPLGAARNEGIARARGRYLAILDVDDTWAPTKLRRQVAVFERHAKTALVFSDCSISDAAGQRQGHFFGRAAPPEAPVRWHDFLDRPNFVPCPTAIMDLELLRAAGGFDPALRYSEEYDLFIRMARLGAVHYVPEVLATYRLHGGNLGGLGTPEMTTEAIEVIRRHAHDPALEAPDLQRVRRRLLKLQLKLFAQLTRRGRTAEAIDAGAGVVRETFAPNRVESG